MKINSDALPITLMHPLLGEFVESYKNAKVTNKGCTFAHELREAALGEYELKSQMAQAVRMVLEEYLNIELFTVTFKGVPLGVTIVATYLCYS